MLTPIQENQLQHLRRVAQSLANQDYDPDSPELPEHEIAYQEFCGLALEHLNNFYPQQTEKVVIQNWSDRPCPEDPTVLYSVAHKDLTIKSFINEAGVQIYQVSKAQSIVCENVFRRFAN